MMKHQLTAVFTPATPATITFVERDIINNRLVRALELPGNQIVLYGHTGSGKSTLLQNILNRTYEKQITTNCMKGMTFDEIILDAFDQLKEFYISEITNNKRTHVNASLKAEYIAMQGQLSKIHETASGDKQQRVMPPLLTGQNLGRLLGESGYCWVIEDFHKIGEEEKVKLAQLMKVCVNLSNTYNELKIIVLGAANTAYQVVQADPELSKRISEIHVVLMNSDEIKNIIKKGCDALNIRINDELQNDIVKYSNGLASICHKICYLLCSAAMISSTVDNTIEFSHEDLQGALQEYLDDAEATLKYAFDCASKYVKAIQVLKVLVNVEMEGAHIDELYKLARDNTIYITKKDLQEYLDNLTSDAYGKILKLDDNTKVYSFIDPFYRCFAMTFFNAKDKIGKRTKLSDQEMLNIINNAMKGIRSNIGELIN